MNDIRVLVVDDSLVSRKILIKMLKNIGLNDVVEAVEGKDGLTKVRNGDVKFIITDWNMPEMDGLEFIQAIKKEPQYQGIPILMVSTRSEKEDIITAIKTGANSYMAKPFTRKVLKEKILSMLQ